MTLRRSASDGLTTDGSPKFLTAAWTGSIRKNCMDEGNFEAYWWSPDSTKLAYLRLDERPVPEFTVVDHIPYDQGLEVTPYPKAGRSESRRTTWHCKRGGRSDALGGHLQVSTERLA